MIEVILAHGLWVPGVLMRPLAGRLEGAGFRCHTFSYRGTTHAMQSHADRIKSVERYLAELNLFAALAKGEHDEAKKLVEDVKDLPKDRLARLWFQVGDTNKALKLAAEAVTGATNQVQVLANHADLLARSGQTDEAVKVFTQ